MEWISCSNSKPEHDFEFVVVTNYKRPAYIFFAIYYKHDDIFVESNPTIYSNRALHVTHWMPLPPVPTE